MQLSEAISAGFLDYTQCELRDPLSGRTLTLHDAYERGLLITSPTTPTAAAAAAAAATGSMRSLTQSSKIETSTSQHITTIIESSTLSTVKHVVRSSSQSLVEQRLSKTAPAPVRDFDHYDFDDDDDDDDDDDYEDNEDQHDVDYSHHNSNNIRRGEGTDRRRSTLIERIENEPTEASAADAASRKPRTMNNSTATAGPRAQSLNVVDAASSGQRERTATATTIASGASIGGVRRSPRAAAIGGGGGGGSDSVTTASRDTYFKRGASSTYDLKSTATLTGEHQRQHLPTSPTASASLSSASAAGVRKSMGSSGSMLLRLKEKMFGKTVAPSERLMDNAKLLETCMRIVDTRTGQNYPIIQVRHILHFLSFSVPTLFSKLKANLIDLIFTFKSSCSMADYDHKIHTVV